MKHIIVLLLFSVLFSCSTTNNRKVLKKDKVPEYAIKLKKLFKIKKASNWEEHYFHGILSYSPIELREKLVADSNYLWINVFESKTSLIKYIEQKNNHSQWIRVKTKNTDYGLCYTDRRTFSKNGKSYMNLRDIYMYEGKIYELILFFESENFYKYLDEAVAMMESFEIIKEE